MSVKQAKSPDSSAGNSDHCKEEDAVQPPQVNQNNSSEAFSSPASEVSGIQKIIPLDSGVSMFRSVLLKFIKKKKKKPDFLSLKVDL